MKLTSPATIPAPVNTAELLCFASVTGNAQIPLFDACALLIVTMGRTDLSPPWQWKMNSWERAMWFPVSYDCYKMIIHTSLKLLSIQVRLGRVVETLKSRHLSQILF